MTHGGCQPGNVDRASVPGPCRRDCLHRAMVADYRATKAAYDEARKLEREAAVNGFATEGAAWDAEHPTWAFRDYLIQNGQR